MNDGSVIVGVITVGRPVSRRRDDGWTLEVTRCCTNGFRNAPSKLYGAVRRAVFAMGYKKLITYTLPSESGASLHGAGYRLIGKAGGGSWSNKDRPRIDKHPLGLKLLWEVSRED